MIRCSGILVFWVNTVFIGITVLSFEFSETVLLTCFDAKVTKHFLLFIPVICSLYNVQPDIYV